MKRIFAALAIGVLSCLLLDRALAQNGDWGTIKGRITWGGDKLPELGEFKLPEGNPSSPDCLKANKGMPPPNETWVINSKNKGIKNTFVWLADEKKKPLPIHPALKEIKVKKLEVDQPACHFTPHALAIRQGQVLHVKNSATFAHNIKWTGSIGTKNSGNVLLPPGASHDIDLEVQRLPILIECNIHPWMRGYLRVFDHPYYAVTDENGAFEIKDAPAGDWRLMVWNSSGWKGGAEGKNGDPVQIMPGKTNDLDTVAFPPPK